MSDVRPGGRKVKDPVPEGMETKKAALKRLDAEGRREEFRERVSKLRRPTGGNVEIPRHEAFYLALKEFPPPEWSV